MRENYKWVWETLGEVRKSTSPDLSPRAFRTTAQAGELGELLGGVVWFYLRSCLWFAHSFFTILSHQVLLVLPTLQFYRQLKEKIYVFAICAQKDCIENGHNLNLFGTMPDTKEAELSLAAAEDAQETDDGEPTGSGAAPRAQTLLKRRGVYYSQSPERVHSLLAMERYCQRWHSHS